MDIPQIAADILRQCRSQAKQLTHRLGRESEEKRGCGHMTVAHYDTAWLAMISKPSGDHDVWLFPQCFEYILEEQLPDGAWPSYNSPVDGILNSLAAILALAVHASKQADGSVRSQQTVLESRIQKAQKGLAALLNAWNVAETVHVGFEILVPSLLGYLEARGIRFDFPGRRELLELNKAKMQDFRLDRLYSKVQLTALHSLEAFIDTIDFSRVVHHKVYGSLFGSPASTAAYLMNADVWDDDAEQYLCDVVSRTTTGAVPSAFPSTIFECTWTLSTLLSGGFTLEYLGVPNVTRINDLLTTVRGKQSGVLGFAPGILPDADDTAKSLYCLQLCGYDVDADVAIMAKTFRTNSHFQTYPFERDPSFSANCNILLALLNSTRPEAFLDDIEKAVSFLCDTFDQGCLRDKWNLSPEYCYMLLVQAFMALMHKWNAHMIEGLSIRLRCRVPVVLFQTLRWFLHGQRSDGSFGDAKCQEVCSYAVIALSSLLGLPFDITIRQDVRKSLERGFRFLLVRQDLWSIPDRIWVEKVSYGSPVLCESYCLAAIQSVHKLRDFEWRDAIESSLSAPLSKVQKLIGFYSRIPLFRSLSSDKLHEAIVEANLYFHRLAEVRNLIFPRANMAEDRYLEHIPLTWTSCNMLNRYALSGDVLWDMMVISMLNYQVDEYMETVAAQLSHGSQELLESIIWSLCGLDKATALQQQSDQVRVTPNVGKHAMSEKALPNGLGPSNPIQAVEGVLRGYINHVLDHPHVLCSPAATQRRLSMELYKFLMAHNQQNQDNANLARQREQPPVQPNGRGHGNSFDSTPLQDRGYFSWVQGVAANHTSCPFAFVFFCCLVSKEGSHCLSNPRQLYLGQSLCRHLAVLCRQYNDYGSVARDRAENNLNSVDFKDLASSEAQQQQQQQQQKEKRQQPTNGHNGSAEIKTDYSAPSDLNENGKRRAAADPGDDDRQATSPSNNNTLTEAAKGNLMFVAEFERECMGKSLERLTGLLVENGNEHAAQALQVFVHVTDLYGQIYVLKDIASRMKK